MQKYTGLWVSYTRKDRRGSQFMCRPYKYLITTHATSFKAFVSPIAFKRWLRERGLKLEYVGRGQARIVGHYYERYTDLSASLNATSKRGMRSMVMSNGRYVSCIISTHDDGSKLVDIHHTGVADTDYSPEATAARLADYRHYEKIYG